MKIKYLFFISALLLTGCVTRTVTVTAPPPPGPSVTDVQSMVQAHVSNAVIVSQIQTSRTRYHLTVDQIIALKTAGASDTVINALINSVDKPSAQSTTTVTRDAYVYPYVYVDPWPWFWWGWGPYYRGGWYYHRHF